MKQAYGQLNTQVKKLESILEHAPVRIQKIFALPNFIVIEIYSRHCDELYLYLGTGKQYQCFFLSTKKPPTNFRIPSKFRSLINKYLNGQMLLSINLSLRDRIITLVASGKLASRFSFYWAGGRLYFIYGFKDTAKMTLKYSWRTNCEHINENEWFQKVENEFSQFGNLEIFNKEQADMKYEELLHIYFFQKTNNKIKNKKLNDLNKKKNRITHNLNQLQKLETLKIWLMENNEIAPEHILLELGIRHKFFKEDNLYKKRSILFDKIKNATADINHLKKINNELEQKILEVTKQADKIINLPISVHPMWENESAVNQEPESKNATSLEFKIYTLLDGTLIGLGLNDQGNDMLRNKWTKKNDYWFHLHKRPSAHAWIRTENGFLDLNSKSIMVVAYLLASESDNVEVDLMYAKREHVKAKSGQVGGVKVSTYKVLRLYTDKSAMELIARVL